MEDFEIYKEGNVTIIQIIDKHWEFTEQDFLMFKTFMFDFLSECMKKHTEQGYLHSSDIDKILKKYEKQNNEKHKNIRPIGVGEKNKSNPSEIGK